MQQHRESAHSAKTNHIKKVRLIPVLKSQQAVPKSIFFFKISIFNKILYCPLYDILMKGFLCCVLLPQNGNFCDKPTCFLPQSSYKNQ